MLRPKKHTLHPSCIHIHSLRTERKRASDGVTHGVSALVAGDVRS